MPPLPPAAPTCPICGQPAETGFVYIRDISDARWISGAASWEKNFDAATGGGLGLGKTDDGFLKGARVPGLYCPRCAKVILDVEKSSA